MFSAVIPGMIDRFGTQFPLFVVRADVHFPKGEQVLCQGRRQTGENQAMRIDWSLRNVFVTKASARKAFSTNFLPQSPDKN